MRNIAIFIFLFFVSVNSCVADELPCRQEINISEDFAFKGLKNRSAELSTALCQVGVYNSDNNPDYSSVYIEAVKWRATALEEAAPLKKADIDLDTFINQSFTKVIQDGKVNAFVLNKIKKSYYIDIDKKNIANIKDDEKCKDKDLGFDKTCYEVLKDFEDAINTVNADSNRIDLAKVAEKIGLYSKQWDKYFYEGRSQTPLELSINTMMYKDELSSNRFVLPPSYQFIVLHPSVIFEYIHNAADGDQEKEALAVEWIGVNWWEKAPWWDVKVPLGVSLVTTHSDRASVDDSGLGLMFHVFNKYSLGFTKRDDDTSFFVTIDLWGFFQGKKERLEYYKNKVNEYNK